jgi:AraC-like DNA-binding protein
LAAAGQPRGQVYSNNPDAIVRPSQSTERPEQLLSSACRRIQEFPYAAATFEHCAPLQRLQRHVDDHPADPLDSAQAAAIAGYERTHFSKYFKETTGVTFKDWNSHRRMRLALQVLSNRDESITAVAEKAGFPDLRAFELHCLRWTGIQPKTLRTLFRTTKGSKKPTN